MTAEWPRRGASAAAVRAHDQSLLCTVHGAGHDVPERLRYCGPQLNPRAHANSYRYARPLHFGLNHAVGGHD